MLSKEFIDILNLSRLETTILKSLTKSPQLIIADIVRATRIPRMTLYPVLNILKKRGLIDFVREGRRRYWSIESA
ncbi:MAG: Sugar-specific transcriptional regulator TrmB, partial [Candidatus Parcubacteria bacterium]